MSTRVNGTQYLRMSVHAAALKFAVASSPVIACFAIIWLRNSYRRVFNVLFTEDSVFEYLTSVLYLLAAVIAGVIAVTFSRLDERRSAALYGLLMLGLFFIAGEEVSWGQRLLGIETPASIAAYNTQNELTVHNLEPIQDVLHWTYVFVGAYGAFAFLLLKACPRNLLGVDLRYVAPGWYLATYFLPAMVLYGHLELATRETAWFRYRSPDQEPVELLLAFGFLLFVIVSRLRQVSDYSMAVNQILRVRLPEERNEDQS